MELDEIERKTACNEITAPRVFTQMKQHVDKVKADTEELKRQNALEVAAAYDCGERAGVDKAKADIQLIHDEHQSYVGLLEMKHKADKLALLENCLKIIHRNSSPGHAYEEVKSLFKQIEAE